jgi:hypothetical protein
MAAPPATVVVVSGFAEEGDGADHRKYRDQVEDQTSGGGLENTNGMAMPSTPVAN